MPAKLKQKYISEEDYLTMEEVSPVRHEYFDGEIFQMAGASDNHNSIAMNISSELHQQLKKRQCKVYQNDMRLYIEKEEIYVYPDVMVVCGKPEFKKYKSLENLLNPILMVEILSDSTADFDKGRKFEHYRTRDSFKEYLLVSQKNKQIMRYTKQPDGSWNLMDFIGDAIEIELFSIECSLSMNDIYDKVEFDA
ncbi:MAG: Uma2 family endonuclease [Pyrinomonadaceae bacterium]|nr:Uma2 family endonuclease [Pyrinomonadaceae bacterium]